MTLRPLGRSGLSIAPLALGGNVFGWTADEAASFRVLDAFVDAGFNLIDTADTYSIWAPGHVGGESETIIGNWLRRSGKRDRVLLATKVGMDMKEGGKGLSRAHILKSVEASLQRLQTDRIDLYQSHAEDPLVPAEETLAAYEQLVRESKVRAIGASNHCAAKLDEAHAVSAARGWPRYESLQPLYNLYDRKEFEEQLAPYCREHEVGVICFFPLGAGFLTGTYRKESDAEGRARAGRVKKYMNPRGWAILAALDAEAASLGANPAQVAIAWTLAQPAITAPIASARTVEQLGDLIAGTRLVLPPESLARLDAASA